jgi:hypothetical protein
MTQAEVLSMMHNIIAENRHYSTWTVSTPHLVMLVNRAIEAEREACANIAHQWSKREDDVGGYIEAAIRARGQT